MSEFWMWFWRPIAEFLGTIALVGAFLIVALIFVLISDWMKRR